MNSRRMNYDKGDVFLNNTNLLDRGTAIALKIHLV